MNPKYNDLVLLSRAAAAEAVEETQHSNSSNDNRARPSSAFSTIDATPGSRRTAPPASNVNPTVGRNACVVVTRPQGTTYIIAVNRSWQQQQQQQPQTAATNNNKGMRCCQCRLYTRTARITVKEWAGGFTATFKCLDCIAA